MISDEIFSKELDEILKIRKTPKKLRNEIIDYELMQTVESRDSVLERNRALIPKKERIPSEDTEQINSVEWFRKKFPDVDILSIRNEGSRTPAEKAKQLCMGLLPGASDLLIPDWHLYIEMKRVKGGVLSKEQSEFCDRRIKNGDYYMVCYGFEHFKEVIIGFYQLKIRKQ